mgnify:CR=1 FL=1
MTIQYRGRMSEEQPKKPKLSTAEKRDKQNVKKNLQNRSFKAKTKTALVRLEKSLEEKAEASTKAKHLNALYSLMDKGVKKGIFKKNKAARTKAKYAAKVA